VNFPNQRVRSIGSRFEVFNFSLIEQQPDLTLEEVVAEMNKQRIRGSRTAVWRFFERHDVSFKKKRYTQASKTGLM
jgi:transposase